MKSLKIFLIVLLLLLLAFFAFWGGIIITGLNLGKRENSINISDKYSSELQHSSDVSSENKIPEKTNAFPSSEQSLKDGEKEIPEGPYKDLFLRHFANFNGDFTYNLHIYSDDYRLSSESRPQKAASIIKLFIMEYAFSLIEKGEISKDDKINGRFLSSLIESMITVSDNNSTNVLINHFTMEKINAYIKEAGYSDTVLQRRMLDTQAASRGEENYTSVKDVMAFLDNLYENKDSFPESEMLDIMKRQTIATKLRRKMPSGILMASKTGELSDTENDCGIVFSEGGDYAIVCLTGGGNLAAARDAMANICREIYDILQSEGETQ